MALKYLNRAGFTKQAKNISSKTVLRNPLDKLDQDLLDYLTANFNNNFHMTEINDANLHHYVDALLAFRASFYSLKQWDMVDYINYFLDQISAYMHPEKDYVPPHQNSMYRSLENYKFVPRSRLKY